MSPVRTIACACTLFTLTLGALTPACGNVENEKPPAPVASVSQPIVNGVTDVDAPINNATFHVQTSSGSCSGSLLTSTVGLSAVHCNLSVGDVLSFGLNNPSANPALPSRTRRIVKNVAVLTPASQFGGGNTPVSVRARDVALVFFSPPVTMDASPIKPTFQRPALQPFGPIGDVTFAVFPGGGVGYGNVATAADGGLTLFPPQQRQFFQLPNLLVSHVDTGGGFGVWVHRFKREVLSGEPHAAGGDSGGPLFQTHPQNPAARDVLGVASGFAVDNCPFPVPSELCQLFGVDDEHAVQIYADITAPSAKAWINAQLDRNGDGRWEGEVDYIRDSFGTPGCDVAADPNCDPGCDAAFDPDCDLVSSQNDNCRLDYNPDQTNTDDPLDPLDRISAADPGDVCDLCPLVPSAQDTNDNCNEDAERLAFGLRPRVRENDAIGPDPTQNVPAPFIAQNLLRYRGDACDPTPCTELAQRRIILDPAKYGAPSPTNVECQLGGGKCEWEAPALIERHPQIAPAQSGGSGSTGYRFCQCDPPFNDQNDRFDSCFTTDPCPANPDVFGTSTRLKPLTVNPPFVPIFFKNTPETGTMDAFTSQAPVPRPSFDWLFENDQLAITGQPNPTLPLTNPSQVAIDGLVHSNVRNHTQLLVAPGNRQLASYWMPMQLRFRVSAAAPFKVIETVKLPGWWMDGCKNDPNCPFGFSVPLYIFPFAHPALLGVTPSQQSDESYRLSPTALSLLGTPGATVIPAAEHGGLLALRGARSAPRVAVVNLQTRSFVGALTQRADGSFAEFGPRGGDGDVGDGPLAASASAKGGATPGASAATLSALHGKLFVLAREASEPKARLHVYDLAARTWTETALSGVHVPEQPVALTYVAQHDALFGRGRKKGPGLGAYELYRIGLDGAVTRLGGAAVGASEPEVYLTSTEEGALLLAASRAKPARHRIAKLSITAHGVEASGRLQSQGVLAAPPFLTRRALTIGLVGADDTLEMQELPVTALAPPFGGPMVWALQ